MAIYALSTYIDDDGRIVNVRTPIGDDAGKPALYAGSGVFQVEVGPEKYASVPVDFDIPKAASVAEAFAVWQDTYRKASDARLAKIKSDARQAALVKPRGIITPGG